jgi:hypothetical protein
MKEAAMPRHTFVPRITAKRRQGALAALALATGISACLIWAQPASAQFATGGSGAPHVQNPDLHSQNCTCRAQGRDFHVGETICLRTADGPRLAACDMELNNTSWRFDGQQCPDS